MKFTGKIFVLGLIMAAFSAQAVETPWIFRTRDILTCPSVGAAYETMLNDLDSLKTTIKQSANCANVQLKVESLEKLVVEDREKFLALVEKSRTTPLTNEEGQQIANYIEELTKKVGSLADLFSGSNYCFEDDEAAENKVASLTGFINEASQLIGSLAGPWGAPIALGGRIVAGFITGMDQINRTRAGYDFSKPLQWRNYVNSLCTYYNFAPQMANLLTPDQQADSLSGLANKLSLRLKTLVERCPECEEILQTFEDNPEKDPTEIIRITHEIVRIADQEARGPLGSYTLQAAALRRWAVQERDRIIKEAGDFSKEASGRYLLFKAKQDLDSFLIERSAPEFIDFQLRESARQWADFQRFLNDKGGEIYAAIEALAPDVLPQGVSAWGRPSGYQVFDVLIRKSVPWEKMKPSPELEDLRYAWKSFNFEAAERVNSYKTALGAFENFCQFFRRSGNYTSGIRAACTQGTYAHLKTSDKKFDVTTALVDTPFSLNVIDAINKTIDEVSYKIFLN